MTKLVQIFIIAAMLVFFFLIVAGSTFESAILKAAIVFSALIILTKMASVLLGIIKVKPATNKTDTKTSPQ
ncbi:MAG: hypothetical protein WD491_05845 [Balneolales bacterium]